MFIRETNKRRLGKTYYQYQLVRSVRTPAGPRQEIILNMGQQLDIPKDKRKDLANAIEEKLLKDNKLFLYDAEIDALAEYYSKLIEKNDLNKQAIENSSDKKNTDNTSPSEIEKPDYETVDINSMEHTDDRTYGGEHLVTSTMEAYNFENVLSGLGFTTSQIQYSKLLICSRMLHPSSEKEAARWLNDASSLPEFVEKIGRVSDNGLHRAAILLWNNHKRIEEKLSDTSKTLFSLKEKVILYDLTNTYFEGSKHGSVIAKRNKSKEKRNDCPLITLALTVDEEGFPKSSKIYKGNIGEPTTLEDFLKEMKESDPNNKRTLVFDAGIATEGNLALIRGDPYNYYYIAVSRKKSYPDAYWKNSKTEEIVLSDKNTTLTIKAKRLKDEVYLLCHSEAKKIKEHGIITRRQDKFEAALQNLHEGLNKKGCTKKYDKILERIGRLKQQYKVGQLYTTNIDKDKKGIVVAINFKRNKKSDERHADLGNYVLRTNRVDLENSEISQIHRSLTTIEDCFRSMKSHLGLRPIYHKEDINSEAHIHVTVLAYYFVIAILKKLRAGNNSSYNWNTIREILETHRRLTTTVKRKDGSVIRLRQNTIPNEKQRDIFKAFGKTIAKGLKRVKQIFNEKM